MTEGGKNNKQTLSEFFNLKEYLYWEFSVLGRHAE